MFGHRRLACSFCGKDAAEVSKLVAGPRVYICDTCVATAARIMNDPAGAPPRAVAAPSLWRRAVEWLMHRAQDLRMSA